MTTVRHAEVVSFCESKVNLPADSAKKYRDQVNALRDRLALKISQDPSFDLVKMLHSGSVAKGTALRTINDLDVAIYVKAGSAPISDIELMPWFRQKLVDANTNLNQDQFAVQDHCVTVSFRGSGLDVDVVPILYEGEEDDYGHLIQKQTGQRILTSVPRHLEFIRSRKGKYGADFSQLIRIVKWWKRQNQLKDSDFRLKSFMIELIWAKLADSGVDMKDYPSALESFFRYLVRSELKERIYFTDYYSNTELQTVKTDAIEIFDPVNPINNVSSNYSEFDRARIVKSAHDALDAIGEAKFAITKSEEIDCWQVILGPGFKG
jgi:hypothetical protein